MTPPPVALPQITLARWLDDVSRPFPYDTARRIRRELEDHALAHVEALREAGHPDPEGAALAALGSPYQVQRELRQEYFTRWEEDQLWSLKVYRRAEPPSVRRWGLDMASGLALPPLLGFLFPVAFGFHWGGYPFYVLVVLLVSGLDRWIPRHFPPRSARVVLVLKQSVSYFVILLYFQTVWPWEQADWMTVTATLIGAGIATLFQLRPLWSVVPKALRGAR